MAPHASATPLPVGTSIAAGSLRAEMEGRRAAGQSFSVREAVGIIVPFAVRLAAAHAAGKRFFVHPSSIRYVRGGELDIAEDRAAAPPTLPRDRACLAPEERKGEPGDARGSVFAVGAILYELITNATVGPGMRRPGELARGVNERLEAILGKALVADPKHRPADLGALAQALHQTVPASSIAPPPADESHLDHDADFDVDVRLSMLPMTPAPGSAALRAAPLPNFPGYPVPGSGADPRRGAGQNARATDPMQRLSDLKAGLEADPRPRYVVVKDGMDHGPFSAVELLQQVASGSFRESFPLRDVFTNDERPIKDWDEFAPFAEQAKLNREIVEEKAALAVVAVAEKEGTHYKILIGAAVFGVFLAGAAGLALRKGSATHERTGVMTDTATTVDIDGGLAGGPGKKVGLGGPMPGGGARPGGGSYPQLSGGMSCDRARSTYVEELKMGDQGPADITAGQYGAVLNRGSYLNSCGVPSNMSVSICAAVQNGRAVGVTVTCDPPNAGISSCVAGQVRALAFPANPRLDVTTTAFAAQ